MKIAISSIIKNEMRFVEKYLERNKDADYICLLDTGSTDGTWEYLQKEANENSKLIVQQKIYNDFRFDIARNDSIKLIPDDTDIIIFLDLDEYFSDDNWREIIEMTNDIVNNDITFYSLFYRDNSDFSITGFPRMLITNNRMSLTKNLNFYNRVHECAELKKGWFTYNKLLIIHEPDKTKSRKSYVSLCEQRCIDDLSDKENLAASKATLLVELYKNNLFERCINIYEEIKNIKLKDDLAKKKILCFLAPYMYKITNDAIYLRNIIKELNIYNYEQNLLYFALKDDLEYCKQYKDKILEKIYEHDIELLERFKSYDILGNKIKEMACEL